MEELYVKDTKPSKEDISLEQEADEDVIGQSCSRFSKDCWS